MFIRRLRCSFCWRPDSRVAQLVAGPRILGIGPRVYICDACVALSADIMKQGEQSRPVARARARLWSRLFGRAHALLRETSAVS